MFAETNRLSVRLVSSTVFGISSITRRTIAIKPRLRGLIGKSIPLLAVLGLLSLSLVSGVGIVGAEEPRFARGEPDLDAHVPSNTIVPGETQAIEFVVTNDGEVELGTLANRNTVTKARNVRATVTSDSDDPLEIETGTRALGSIIEDHPQRTTIQVTVPDSTAPGEYDLDVELEYSYTRQISDNAGVTSERSTSTTKTITLEVDDDAQFIVRNTSTTASVGDSGVVSLQIENVGEQSAYNASVQTTSTNENLVFGESTADETHAGSWEPGEVKTITHDVIIRDQTSVRPYTLDTSVSFDDSDGVSNVDEGITSNVSPLGEQTFTVVTSDSTLRVDEEGWLRGDVRNEGPATVESVEVVTPLQNPNLFPITESSAIGDLDPGESGTFEIHLDVGSDAEAVRTLVDVNVRYRTADRDMRVNDDSDVIVDIEDRRDTFTVASSPHEITAGSSTTVTVELTNNLDETVTHIEPKLFTDDPLSSPNDIAFVPRLESGETTTVQFEVQAAENAMAKQYGPTIDVRYDGTEGKSKISDTYRTSITVAETDGKGNSFLVAGLVVLIVGLSAGVYRWKLR